jgi:S1-C subfamily serine protease
MEGSCILSESGAPVAILLPPLRHRPLGTELYFAVPLEHLCSAVHQQTSISHPNLSPSIEHHAPLQQQAGTATASAQSGIDTAMTPKDSSKQYTDVLQWRLLNQHAPTAHSTALDSQILCCRAAQSAVSCSSASVPLVSEGSRLACAAERPRQQSVEAAVADAAARATVLIECGSSWASGVILDAASGIVVTAAHAVSRSQPITVRYSCFHCRVFDLAGSVVRDDYDLS